MNDLTLIPAQVCAIIADELVMQNLMNSLPDYYSVVVFKDIESFQQSQLQVPAQIILCHQSLLDSASDEILEALCRQFIESRVLVIGPALPVASQISALKHGARGYFNQELPPEKLNEAIQLLLNGEVWVERHVITGLIDELTQPPRLSAEQQSALDSLSPKEIEVAKLVSHGATNKMIAKTMDITERTVKAHLTTIFQKMSLPDRLSLAIFFRDLR